MKDDDYTELDNILKGITVLDCVPMLVVPLRSTVI